MNIRRELTVMQYDFWLDFYNAHGRPRRELRRELRANLADAEAAGGWERARAGVGNLRELAREHAAAVRASQALRWADAIGAALVMGMLLFGYAFWMMTAFADGAEAAGWQNGRKIEGNIFFVPGSRVELERTDATSGIQMFLPLWYWWPMLLTFVLALRPWRLWGRRRGL